MQSVTDVQEDVILRVDHRKEKYKDDQIFRFKPRVNNDEINGWFICD